MSILVFGKTGQVATELARASDDLILVGREEADLSDPAACARIISETKARAVINAAAWTAVDRAEAHEAEARVINGDAPGVMAAACAARRLPFVHISTDYVFAGDGTAPWRPGDAPRPQNAYGRTKLAGETGIRAVGGPHAILRTSWVVSAHGANFVRTMLRLGAERSHLSIVADQVGGPTPAADIARACLRVAEGLIADPSKSGVYHLSGGPDVSWADFAREIFAQAGLSVDVADIPTSDYPTPAARPLNSRMCNARLAETFGIDRPDWRAGLGDILQELGAAR